MQFSNVIIIITFSDNYYYYKNKFNLFFVGRLQHADILLSITIATIVATIP